MLKALLRYNYTYYLRSYRYLLPLTAYLLWLAFFYNYKGLPVGDTYMISAVIIFLLSSWLGLGFIDMEHPVQQQLTILHIGSQNVFYLSRILFIWAVSVFFSLISIFIPVIMGLFHRPVRITEVIVFIVIHAVLGLAGILVAVFFNSRLIQDRRFAILLYLLILVLTLLQEGIAAEYAWLRWITWLLPPIWIRYEQVVSWPVILQLMISVIYAGALAAIFIKVMKWKRLY